MKLLYREELEKRVMRICVYVKAIQWIAKLQLWFSLRSCDNLHTFLLGFPVKIWMRFDVVLLREQWEIKMTNICDELVARELSSVFFSLSLALFLSIFCVCTVFDLQTQCENAAEGNDIEWNIVRSWSFYILAIIKRNHFSIYPHISSHTHNEIRLQLLK